MFNLTYYKNENISYNKKLVYINDLEYNMILYEDIYSWTKVDVFNLIKIDDQSNIILPQDLYTKYRAMIGNQQIISHSNSWHDNTNYFFVTTNENNIYYIIIKVSPNEMYTEANLKCYIDQLDEIFLEYHKNVIQPTIKHLDKIYEKENNSEDDEEEYENLLVPEYVIIETMNHITELLKEPIYIEEKKIDMDKEIEELEKRIKELQEYISNIDN
jgi:hypothetical protein